MIIRQTTTIVFEYPQDYLQEQEWCKTKDDRWVHKSTDTLGAVYENTISYSIGQPSNSEKPNNSTSSKMEQVEDEPQTPYDNCQSCLHWVHDGYWYCECNECRYEPKDEPFDKDINVRSKDELMTKGVWNAGYKTGYDKGYKDAQKVKDSQDLVKELVKTFCEDGTWLERQGVYTLTLAEAKQRAVDIIESVLAKDEPTTQTETQNSNLTFEKDECAKEYEELGLKELKELIEADRKDEFFREPTAEERKAVADYIDSISVPTGVNIFDLMDEPQTDCYVSDLCKHYGDKQICGRCRSRNLFCEAEPQPQTERSE